MSKCTTCYISAKMRDEIRRFISRMSPPRITMSAFVRHCVAKELARLSGEKRK